jgi:predicted RNase H-like HicB family nuclease
VPRYLFSAIVDHDSDGYYAGSPELPGCYAQGETREEALENLREACVLHVEDRLACGEDIPCLDPDCSDTAETVTVVVDDVPITGSEA